MGYYVRTFLDGDEEEIIQIFEEYYSNYAGYVQRTPEYWRWCCLERPDVDRKGVLIVKSRPNGRMGGYAVVGKSGNIWEFCYNRRGDEIEIVQLLLEAVTDYLEGAGTSLANLEIPIEDDIIRMACAKLGFAEIKSQDVYVSVLDFQRLLLLLSSDKKKKLRDMKENVEIRLKDAPKWMDCRFGIKIMDGAVDVLDKDQKPTITIETDVSTLSSLLIGRASPFLSWFYRKVRVRPFWKIRRFFSLLSIFPVKKFWFTPLSDYG